MGSEISPRDVASFQAALLEVFHAEARAPEIRARLLGHPDAQAFKDLVSQFEDRMLEVAAELTRKWGVPARTVTPSSAVSK